MVKKRAREYIKVLENYLMPCAFLLWMNYRNLVLIGTSHIAKESLKEVKDTIESVRPDIVALELDRDRYRALHQKSMRRLSIYDARKVGMKGFVFAMIAAWAEKKLGRYTGMSPGGEMKAAIRIAKKNKIRIALIDQPIGITLKKFSKSLSWKEKWNFVKDIWNAVLKKGNAVEFDLRTVPKKELITKMLKEVKKKYPNIYRVLVTERNKIMANNLYGLMTQRPTDRIVAIVGAGHEEEIIRLIERRFESRISYSFSVNQNP